VALHIGKSGNEKSARLIVEPVDSAKQNEESNASDNSAKPTPHGKLGALLLTNVTEKKKSASKIGHSANAAVVAKHFWNHSKQEFFVHRLVGRYGNMSAEANRVFHRR
jgi:hypothetical protein